MSELAEAQRADLLACYARIEQLGAALAEIWLRVPESARVLLSIEFQPRLGLDEE